MAYNQFAYLYMDCSLIPEHLFLEGYGRKKRRYRLYKQKDGKQYYIRGKKKTYLKQNQQAPHFQTNQNNTSHKRNKQRRGNARSLNQQMGQIQNQAILQQIIRERDEVNKSLVKRQEQIEQQNDIAFKQRQQELQQKKEFKEKKYAEKLKILQDNQQNRNLQPHEEQQMNQIQNKLQIVQQIPDIQKLNEQQLNKEFQIFGDNISQTDIKHFKYIPKNQLEQFNMENISFKQFNQIDQQTGIHQMTQSRIGNMEDLQQLPPVNEYEGTVGQLHDKYKERTNDAALFFSLKKQAEIQHMEPQIRQQFFNEAKQNPHYKDYELQLKSLIEQSDQLSIQKLSELEGQINSKKTPGEKIKQLQSELNTARQKKAQIQYDYKIFKQTTQDFQAERLNTILQKQHNELSQQFAQQLTNEKQQIGQLHENEKMNLLNQIAQRDQTMNQANAQFQQQINERLGPAQQQVDEIKKQNVILQNQLDQNEKQRQQDIVSTMDLSGDQNIFGPILKQQLMKIEEEKKTFQQNYAPQPQLRGQKLSVIYQVYRNELQKIYPKQIKDENTQILSNIHPVISDFLSQKEKEKIAILQDQEMKEQERKQLLQQLPQYYQQIQPKYIPQHVQQISTMKKEYENVVLQHKRQIEQNQTINAQIQREHEEAKMNIAQRQIQADKQTIEMNMLQEKYNKQVQLHEQFEDSLKQKDIQMQKANQRVEELQSILKNTNLSKQEIEQTKIIYEQAKLQQDKHLTEIQIELNNYKKMHAQYYDQNQQLTQSQNFLKTENETYVQKLQQLQKQNYMIKDEHDRIKTQYDNEIKNKQQGIMESQVIPSQFSMQQLQMDEQKQLDNTSQFQHNQKQAYNLKIDEVGLEAQQNYHKKLNLLMNQYDNQNKQGLITQEQYNYFFGQQEKIIQEMKEEIQVKSNLLNWSFEQQQNQQQKQQLNQQQKQQLNQILLKYAEANKQKMAYINGNDEYKKKTAKLKILDTKMTDEESEIVQNDPAMLQRVQIVYGNFITPQMQQYTQEKDQKEVIQNFIEKLKSQVPYFVILSAGIKKKISNSMGRALYGKDLFGKGDVGQKDEGTTVQDLFNDIGKLIVMQKEYGLCLITDQKQRVPVKSMKRRGAIIIFLKDEHYTCCVVNSVRFEACYFDSLAIGERFDKDKQQIVDFILNASPEVQFKLKNNKNPWQDVGKYPRDTALCGQYVLIFLHNYINLGETYKKATDFDGDDYNLMSEIQNGFPHV